MRALFIGGTGTISTAVSKICAEHDWEIFLLNRGTRSDAVPDGAKVLQADIDDEEKVADLIRGMKLDVIADFICYTPSHVKRDIRLFTGKTRQFIFISSASAYQKPLAHFKITEGTPLANPFAEYSNNKIACELDLMEEYRKTGFPVTLVRPSYTYDERKVPMSVHGRKGTWQVLDRIRRDKPVLVHGDGSSLWTMTHSSDFARAFLGIMGNEAAIGEAVNITSDESLTWDAIYDLIGAALGKQVQKFHVTSDFLAACDPELKGGLIGDKSTSVVFDNSKLKRLVPGYVATVPFAQGIRRTVNHILSHPDLQIPDEEFDRFSDRVIMVQEDALSKFKEM